MTTLKTLMTRLEALDDDFMIYSSSASPPTAENVEAIEKALGVRLRPDHRALVAEMGSLAIVVKEEVWPRPVELAVRPAWQFSYGVEVFGIAPETAPALDVVVQTSKRTPEGGERLVAAMRRIGDRACVGYDAKGSLYSWEPGGEPEAEAGSSLFDILLGWVRTLDEDKEKLKSAALAPGQAPKAKKATSRSADQWLAELLDDSGEQDEVAEALMKESPELRQQVIDAVVSALDEDPEDTDALWALARMEADERAVDALIRLATERRGDVRITALGILGALDGKPARARAVLVRALEDPDLKVLSEAAEALGGHVDPSAIAPLTKALARIQANPRWVYGVEAGHVFAALGSAASEASETDLAQVLEVLTQNLAPAESRYAALPAFHALIAMKDKARAAVPKLETAAAGEEPYLATLARHALVAITGDPKPHLVAIKGAMKSKEGAVRSVAESALRDAEFAAILARACQN